MSVHLDNEIPKVSNFLRRYHKTAFVIKFHTQFTHIPAIYEKKCAKTSNISKLIFFFFGLYYEGCFHANFRKINNSLFFTFYYVQFLLLLSLFLLSSFFEKCLHFSTAHNASIEKTHTTHIYKQQKL